jgi:hypothetical protein
MSFSSPEAALDAIKACLDPMSTRIHTGLLNSGLTLDCCDNTGKNQPLIRIESANTMPIAGIITIHGLSKSKCRDLVMDVLVTYKTCFEVFDGDSPEAVPIGDATTAGRAIMGTWWEALKRLACCTPTNQLVRFSMAEDLPPEGGCAGWQMRLHVDLSICDCTDVD